MNLLTLPLSTSLSDVEKRIVQAFLRNSAGARRPYTQVYQALARRLQCRVADVKAIERAMVARLGAEQAAPVPVDGYGHSAAVLDSIWEHHAAGD
jgi:hypothetical protein